MDVQRHLEVPTVGDGWLRHLEMCGSSPKKLKHLESPQNIGVGALCLKDDRVNML
jgi:hypothetical protein